LETWQNLLQSAYRCIDSLGQHGLARPLHWTLGGGTVLMLRYRHRLSRDIDIFIEDVQFLTFLSPRLNDDVAAIASDYLEASNSLKLVLPDGEIDFVVAPRLTPAPYEPKMLLGRDILIETPAEILVKKAFYRAADLRIRDIFDIAVVLAKDEQQLADAKPILKAKKDVLSARLQAIRPRFEAEMATIDLLPGGDIFVAGAIERVMQFVADLP
jgi:hypothetical protein